MDYVAGVDLGQTRDRTTLAVVTSDDLYKEVLAFNEEVRRRRYSDLQFIEPHEPIYEVVHLERLPLGTSYPDIVDRVRTLLTTPPLRDNADLAVDATGVGAPVVDMLRSVGLTFKSVVITGGEKEVREGDTYRVPKRDLVAAPQVLLQSRRLKIAPGLPEARTLTEELLNFRYEITRSKNDVYGAWREGDHDDLILAVALAVWAIERPAPPVHAPPVHARGGRYTFGVFPPLQERPFPPLKGPLF